MDTFVEPAELADLLDDGTDAVRVVDVRWALDDPAAGPRAYAQAHVPGAVFLGWLTDWSDPGDRVEGQLAAAPLFAEVLGRAGIGPDTTVVAYDDGVLYLAARLTWALRHYGHDRVRILAGGFPAWLRAGLPTTADVPAPAAREFPVPEPGALRATLPDVVAALEDGSAAIVDCRMPSTYAAAGGHIPGATRLPAPQLFDPGTGRLRDAGELRRQAEAAGVAAERPTILYCGAGVSAAAAYVALREIGIEDVRVYDGSWSEWCTTPGTPREEH
ncbi:sulfurtransferase [Pseudonocardia sp.]|uniref:sulfurtransferase n=1 Tax=Pseudonocardia sp. TaxID=60912 RepID=UPI003D0F7C7B